MNPRLQFIQERLDQLGSRCDRHPSAAKRRGMLPGFEPNGAVIREMGLRYVGADPECPEMLLFRFGEYECGGTLHVQDKAYTPEQVERVIETLEAMQGEPANGHMNYALEWNLLQFQRGKIMAEQRISPPEKEGVNYMVRPAAAKTPACAPPPRLLQ